MGPICQTILSGAIMSGPFCRSRFVTGHFDGSPNSGTGFKGQNVILHIVLWTACYILYRYTITSLNP